MNYRCLTCGYAQDFAPSTAANLRNHKGYVFQETDDCPGCIFNIQIIGGRKDGKIEMPHFEKVGKLLPETPEVHEEFTKIEANFHAMMNGDIGVAQEYKTKRAWGYTGDELLELHERSSKRKDV